MNGAPRRPRHPTNSEWVVAAIRRDTDECIIFPFGKTADGYGQVTIRARHDYAHRVACKLAHGEPPPGHEVAHRCGMPSCVNPRHLRWATSAANNADRLLHGTMNRGERNGIAKLTAEAVREIRARRAAGESLGSIAASFGIANSHVCAIAKGTYWGWLS